MRGLCTYLLVTFLASLILACDHPTRHYSSMGCIASCNLSSNGCPSHYHCPSLTDRQPDKCYFHGKVYDIDTQIPSEETSGSCTILFCSDFDGNATFTIAIIDCAEFFYPVGDDCVRQYRRDQCCSSGHVCGSGKNNLRTCTVGNQTYYEGERYNAEGDPCKVCICTVDSGGFQVENCYEQKCSFEYTDTEKLLQGAAPVYREGWCCPVDWRLPTADDKVAKKLCNANESDQKCQYGNLTLNIGDALERVTSDQGNINCRCEVPPLVHCVLEDKP